jgi:O-antigen ligase
MAITLGAIALLYSRGAWLAAAAVLAVCPTIVVTRAQVTRIAVAGVVVAMLAGLFITKNQMLRQLAVGDATPVNGYQLELATPAMRFDLWRRTGRMIADHPLAGVGLGNFQQVFESRYNPELNNDGRRGVHAHNLWLQQYAETGAFGGTVYLAIWVWAFWRAWGAARRDQSFAAAGALLGLTALAVTNVTTNMFYMPGLASGRLYALAWLFFGLIAARRSGGENLADRRGAIVGGGSGGGEERRLDDAVGAGG